MIARRSNQRVLPPCASGLFPGTGFTPRAACVPGAEIAAGMIWRGPGRPRGPP
jgi:hypothetical protein